MNAPTTFKIAHDGDRWQGSFQQAVTEAIGGLVHDGPIAVTLTLRDDDDNVYRVEDVIERLDQEQLYCERRTVNRWEHLLAVEVF